MSADEEYERARKVIHATYEAGLMVGRASMAEQTTEGEVELTAEGGVILIPVAHLPAGSTITITITVGEAPAPAEPAPVAPVRKYTNGGRK